MMTNRLTALTFLAGVSLFGLAGDVLAQPDRDRDEMAAARKMRKELLSKRHDMKDPKVRAEIVRQLKEAEDKLQTAVDRRAKAKGLKTSGARPGGGNFRLIDFDEKGTPIYEDTMNLDAAITTAADKVRDNPIYQNAVQVQIEAESYSSMNGVQLETTTDTGGGQNVAYIDNGDWCEYTIHVPAAGQYRLGIRTASNNANGGTISLSVNGSPTGNVAVPYTNGWQNWTTVLAYVNFTTTGNHTLRMNFSGGAGSLFNVNWFSYNRTVIIGQWETNTARLTHRELAGKVSVWDGTTPGSDQNHATHVAGTLVSRGINANTLGMAPEGSVAAFTSGNVVSEMLANGAASPNTTGIHLSNHSYGVTRGWRKDDDGIWEWKGEYSAGGNQASFVDKDFGRYNSRSEEWDSVSYSNPYFLIFVSAGNGRENGPNTGDPWKYQDNFSTVTVPSYDPATHPLNNRNYTGDTKGYITMEGGTISKNTIAVGSSDEGVLNGVRNPGEAEAENYSCRGPTDDGRIKPDIHGNGSGLTSSIASSDTATASYSGTSMSSPNVCGSAALLISYYNTRFPAQSMRASTLKALILHTADDRGKAGPDYKYGWGLMNTEAAAQVIKNHADGVGGGHMIESTVNNTATPSRTHTFAWNGTSPLRVTLCWTDPASPEITGHDSRTPALVNNLNLKVNRVGGSTHLPYVMPYVGDWTTAKFETTATTGVNNVDNVEQVYLAAPAAGTYVVTVNFAGALTNGAQDYSLIVTGQTAAEIEVEENGSPVVPLVDNSGVRNFGAAAPSAPSVLRTYTIRNTGGSPLTGLAITKSGAHPGDFTVGALSKTVLSTGETATFTVSYDPLGTGTRTASLQIASNDSDENPFDIHLTATGLTELEAWRFTHFGTTANTGSAADGFDFDSDNLANLAEFGLATNPKVADPNPVAFALNEAQAQLEYSRSTAAMTEYNFDVIWTDDLSSVTWSTSGVTEEILGNNGAVQDVRASVPRGASEKRFLRVRISPK